MRRARWCCCRADSIPPRCWRWRARQGSSVTRCRWPTDSGTQAELSAAAACRAVRSARASIASCTWISRSIGGSALTDSSHRRARPTPGAGIPVTYVPARNTIMLSLALAWAEVLKAARDPRRRERRRLFGLSGLPSGVRGGVRAASRQLATKAGVEGAALAIRAPLIHMSKAQIVREGVRLGVDYSLTVSCYQADAAGAPAACCDSCRLRREGFVSAGIPDPTRYRLQQAKAAKRSCRLRALPRRVGSSAVEQRPFKALVVGSSPTRPTNQAIRSPRPVRDSS